MYGWDRWADALSVANGRAALTGYRHEVYLSRHAGRWWVMQTSDPLAPLVVSEQCS